ncbi:MAG TPA: fatty acid oxidation complex subunit alpha FadB [Methylocella sp.]|nr:fatty acid oxidation complex subunit alpha FadB [Methylocella sp.]
MFFDGQTIKVEALENDIAELRFERGQESVNKLDALAFRELRQAVDAIRAAPSIRGVIITSAKETFIVGADIFEFIGIFQRPEAEVAAFVAGNSAIITALGDLPVPSVAAINGLALGGGFEVALAADYRVISDAAKVGLPEITLGIFPGYGGTVRLPRLVGLAAGAEWIISGSQQSAESAAQRGAVDAAVAPEALRPAALSLLEKAIADKAGWQARRARLRQGLGVSPKEAASLLGEAEAQANKVLPHYPAAQAVVDLLKRASGLDREAALQLEAAAFGQVAKTQAARSLVAIFVNDQAVKKSIRRYAKDAPPVTKAAVAGAGIMGGGIAYQSAARGIPIVMKDISSPALDLGMKEAEKTLDRSVESGKLARDKARKILSAITPTLTYDGFNEAGVVIEAVIEDPSVKQKVLGEIEDTIGPSAVLASNTSSLRINTLAESLRRPENFLGMHFFNPVPKMPLIEVVRGNKTSERAIATVIGYAAAMGKTPILVGDCPGFVVNRILTPYLIAFLRLIHDGADFAEIDNTMEAFGWPMGPAYLCDVIGLDISDHVVKIVSSGFAPRMAVTFETALDVLLRSGRLGQKKGSGFYRYQTDAKGRPRKEIDPEVESLLAPVRPNGDRSFQPEDVRMRMMLPLILEAARCLEDRIAASPADIDMCLILGLGLPRYLGGALTYADWLGLKPLITTAERFAHLGPLYQPSERLRAMAAAGENFYPL